ncbi:MAG: hypothetical protein WDO15_27955 [Bacteroidota bacterium]
MKQPVIITTWVIFWTIAYFVLLSIFASSSEWQNVDYIYTFIFMLTLMAAVGTNEYSRRRLLTGRKYGLWLLRLFVIGVAFASVNQLIFNRLIDYILPGYYFISYYSLVDLLKFFEGFLVLTTLISLSIERFSIRERKGHGGVQSTLEPGESTFPF